MARKLNKAKKEPGSLLSRQRAKLRAQLAQKEADAKQRNIEKYEQEKAARKTKYGYSQHLMGGSRSSSNYNPRQRTFEEFMMIVEAKVDKSLPEYERSKARLARYDNPSGALALGGGQQRARRQEHEDRRGKKK